MHTRLGGIAEGKEKPPAGIAIASTMVSDDFLATAARFNVSPEMLLSFAARSFMENEPKSLDVVSAAPIDTQDCARCPLSKRCSSALRRVRDKLICFEAIAVALGLLFIPQQSATLSHVEQPQEMLPLREKAVLPTWNDQYLKPKMRAKFAKKHKRHKHAAVTGKGIMLAWNTIVRAGYENARRR